MVAHDPSRRLLLGAGAALLGSPLLAACGADGTGDKGYVDGDGVITQIAAADRRAVGTIAGRTLKAQSISLSGLGRKPVVLNVWASWCPPCRKEAPLLGDAQRSLGDRAAFLGINVRDPGGTARPLAYERRFEVPYPSLYDPSGRALLELPGRLSPTAIPSTVIIDSRGRVAATVLGEVPSAQTVVDLVEDAG